MGDIEPLNALDLFAADLGDEIERAHQAGETDTSCRIRAGLDKVNKVMRGLTERSDVAVLDLLPPDEKQGRRTIRGKVVVDGITYTRAPDEVKPWQVAKLIREAIEQAEGDIDRMVENVVSILPEKPYFLVGKPDEDGVRGLGLNPDDFRTPEVRGYKLERKG